MQGKSIQLASEEAMFLQASSSAWSLFGLFLGDKLGILTRLPKSSFEAMCVQKLSEETK